MKKKQTTITRRKNVCSAIEDLESYINLITIISAGIILAIFANFVFSTDIAFNVSDAHEKILFGINKIILYYSFYAILLFAQIVLFYKYFMFSIRYIKYVKNGVRDYETQEAIKKLMRGYILDYPRAFMIILYLCVLIGAMNIFDIHANFTILNTSSLFLFIISSLLIFCVIEMPTLIIFFQYFRIFAIRYSYNECSFDYDKLRSELVKARYLFENGEGAYRYLKIPFIFTKTLAILVWRRVYNRIYNAIDKYSK